MKIFAGNNPPIGNLVIPMATLDWKIGTVLSSGDSPDVLLVSFSINDVEITDVRKCFDDVTHIFAFGRNVEQSTISVSVLYFISSSCKKSLDLGKIRKSYDDARLYHNDSPMTISVAGETFSGFLRGMSIGGTDASTQTCTITFTFMTAEDS